jgi:hypothetical protein
MVAVCLYLAQLKWTRVHDRKKARRKLWGDAKYMVLPYVKRFPEPYGPWMVERYTEEMKVGVKEGETFKRSKKSKRG